MKSIFGWAVLALTVLAPAIPAQQFRTDISLTGSGDGGAARPFGISHEPSRDRIYVAVAGSFADPNDAVVVIDPVTDTLIGEIRCGSFPEDLAFAYDALGQFRFGAVTNSNDGSVTIWDAQDRVVATVPLPDPLGLGTCYPFAITTTPSGSHFLVSTVDGSGAIYAIDLATLAHDPTADLSVPWTSGSRMAWQGADLLIGTTRYSPGFSGSEAGWARFRADGLGGFTAPTSTLLVPDRGDFAFPGTQELLGLADGRVVLGGLSFYGRLYLLDAQGALQRSLPLTSTTGAHGLAVDPSGELLAACDLSGNRLVLLDLLNETELSTTNLSTVGRGYGQPNDAVFAHGKLYLTSQSTEEVVVFDQLPDPTPGPAYAEGLVVSDPTPMPGDTLTVTLTGPGVLALAFARDDTGQIFHGLDIEIGPGAVWRATGVGSLTDQTTLPPHPVLRGTHLWVQGAVEAATLPRLTRPQLIVIQ